VLAVYVRLEGVDRDVFEAIHELQSRWVVTNFDALEARQFDQAYARVAPSAAEVRDLVGSDSSEIGESLARLVEQRVVAYTDGGYRLRF
jgi:hypothetical protein